MEKERILQHAMHPALCWAQCICRQFLSCSREAGVPPLTLHTKAKLSWDPNPLACPPAPSLACLWPAVTLSAHHLPTYRPTNHPDVRSLALRLQS